MGVLIEKIQHGWGYDTTGHWHGETSKILPIRKAAEIEYDDPLAPARGTMWGLLFSTIFWLLIGAAATLWWKMARL